MKIANKVFGIILVLFFLSCEEKNLDKIILKNKIAYNQDSIYYNIDVEWNEKGNDEELFLVTRTITVKDSSFGGYINDENWKRAWQYMAKEYPEMESPNFMYRFFISENDKLVEFASITYDGRELTYPILRQGEFSNLNSNIIKSKNVENKSSTFLRIMEINNDNLDTKSINLMCENKKWYVFSKEIMNHNNKLEYCIDTTNNNFSLKKMNMHYIFDYPQSDFNCK